MELFAVTAFNINLKYVLSQWYSKWYWIYNSAWIIRVENNNFRFHSTTQKPQHTSSDTIPDNFPTLKWTSRFSFLTLQRKAVYHFLNSPIQFKFIYKMFEYTKSYNSSKYQQCWFNIYLNHLKISVNKLRFIGLKLKKL